MKNRIKKIIACLMAASMVFTILGCNDSKNDSSGVSLDPENPTTVTIWNYYNGDQLVAFEKLVEQFNDSVGQEKGIFVVSVSQGDIETVANSLLDSVNGIAGAEVRPSLAAIYAETGYILDEKKALVSFDDYFSKDELSEYIPEFIEEGRFNKSNDLLLFPVSKSTEVFVANKTDWEKFAKATGVRLESIKTQEDLVSAAKKYYEWTDSLTPNVKEDGKALYGRDSIANYMYIGSYQLGHELFSVNNGEVKVDIDHDTFKKLWDNYYIPYINGYFGAYANFRSEDAKTGKILSLTSSTSGTSYLPDQVTLEDDTVYPIEIETKKSLRFANAKNDVTVQQGAGYCLLKTNEAEQEGAVEFLKWFTDYERNLKFSLMSGYSAVTKEANNVDAIKNAYQGDEETAKGKNVLNSLLISAEEFTSNSAYNSKPFSGSKDVRSILESSMKEIAIADREAVVSAIAEGKTRKEAVKKFSTEEYFNEWFNNIETQIMEKIK